MRPIPGGMKAVPGGMRAIPGRVWIAALLFLLAINLPYGAGALNAPTGGTFTGNPFEQTRVDYNSHLARIQLGYQGEWSWRILFTPEDHPPILAQTLYMALGHLARLFGLTPVAIYQIARNIFALIMLLTVWLFVAHFLRDGAARWWAFLLALVTGGLGWLLYLIMPAQTTTLAPIEFWLLDAYTFLAALTFPHFSAAVALLTGYFLLLDCWLGAPTWRTGIGLAALLLLLGNIQPFDLLLTGAATGLAALRALWKRRLRSRHVLMLIPAAIVSAATVLYDYTVFTSHPVWQAFTAQNLTLSPPPIYYLFGYAWLLVPAAIGLVAAWRARDETVLLPVIWVALVAALIYAPLVTQRRFLMGVQIPLAVLGAFGLVRVRAWWQRRGYSAGRWRLLMATLLCFSALSHILFVASAVATANPEVRPLLFLTTDDLEAQDWLRRQPPDSVVLSAFSSGGQIAGLTGRRVYLGHWIETANFAERQEQVRAFFTTGGMSDSDRQALLADGGIDYVWFDDAARQPGGWDPAGAPYLTPVFASDRVVVYEVVR